MPYRAANRKSQKLLSFGTLVGNHEDINIPIKVAALVKTHSKVMEVI